MIKLSNFKIPFPDAVFILRVWTGILFAYHGLSFFNHTSILNFADFLVQMKIPYPVFFSYLSIGTEFFGEILLCIGLFTRPVCVIHIINMAVASFIAEKGNVFESAQLSFILLLIVITILFSKQTYFSIDILRHKKWLKNFP